ncbi:MAG: Hsp20 family protein [Cellvibrionaceae bacterium]
MRDFDFSPLYRSSIGFDRVASVLDNLVNSELTAKQAQPNYPPYNIELADENNYRISMAVAGFDQSELEIETEMNKLVVRGRKVPDQSEKKYLHQGIAARNFERQFQLADHVRVTDARSENGLLHIDLVRELPEVMKPRKVQIQSHAASGEVVSGEPSGVSSDKAILSAV